MSERLLKPEIKIPTKVSEQLLYIPSESYRINVCQQLFKGLVFFLTSYGVEIDISVSGYRTKTLDRVNEKIIRRKSDVAMRDIYGVRIITEDTRREWIKDLIQSAYPLTPKVFPDGKPSVREYADPVVREFFREKHNPHTSPIYSAMHVNIAFERVGSPYLDIAEIQIMNNEELGIYNDTRDEYLQKQNST